MIVSDPKSVNEILTARDAEVARSLNYVASLLELSVSAPPGGPFTSACYATAVTHLSRKNVDAARSTLELLNGMDHQPEADCLGWKSAQLPDAMWTVLQALFDTDPNKPFAPQQATSDHAAQFKRDHRVAVTLLQDHYPLAKAELDQLISTVFLAEPPTVNAIDDFGGASTFFCPGAAIVNVKRPRNIAKVVEVLLHEASHLLLFALAGSGGLTKNDPAALYNSPLRNDQRPMEGIFHAVFVCSRVHHVLQYMRYEADLPVSLRSDFEQEIRNAQQSALTGFETLKLNCSPTDIGASIMTEIQGYWETQGQHIT